MRRYAIFFISVPVALVCFRLGFWQLSRLHERRAHNAEQRAALAFPPIDLSNAPASLGAFRAVRGAGRFDYQRQVIVDGAEVRGVPATIVVTPLQLGDGSAVLVDRGWVPSSNPGAFALEALKEGDSVIVNGAVMAPGPEPGFAVSADSVWPKHLQRPTPGSLGALYPYRLRPYIVRRTDAPAAGQRLRLLPLPALTDGPHLGYVVQWWSFALIALVGSVFLYRKDREGVRSAG